VELERQEKLNYVLLTQSLNYRSGWITEISEPSELFSHNNYQQCQFDCILHVCVAF